MPYRADLRNVAADALDRLVELGAIDVEPAGRGAMAVLLPDSVGPAQVAAALGISVGDIAVSAAAGRDEGSVWVLAPRSMSIGSLRIVPADAAADPGALRLIDSAAFGTGLHPTTALCLEVLQDEVRLASPAAVLDVGTGSGILALAALMLGVPRATGIDTDDEALRVAAENARINRIDAIDERLELTRGGPDAIAGSWPLVLANVLPGPLIEMAPSLVRRVAHHGRLVLSGIPASAGQEVDRAYQRLGMRHVRIQTRAGWVAIVLQASW